jgi:hypothetical protein
MCSKGKLLMMDTVVSETCWATESEIKFYDFKTDVHLVGFYSFLPQSNVPQHLPTPL